MILPGSLYWADLEVGRHPVLVLSRESLNRGNTVMAALITSSKFSLRSTLPNSVVFRAGEYGLKRDCVAMGESLGPAPADLIDMRAGPIGMLDAAKRREAVRAIGYILEAECEPQ